MRSGRRVRAVPRAVGNKRAWLRAACLIAAPVGLAGCLSPPGPDTMQGMVAVGSVQAASRPGAIAATVPFIFDSQRVLVELAFVRPDGAERKTLAWVNMGVSGPVLSPALYRELGIGQGRPLRFAIGAVPVEVAGSTVTDGPGELGDDDALDHLFAPHRVEAVLPAGVLQQFQVTLDYAARQMTVARPGVPHPAGVAVPFRIKEGTGFITVDAAIGGRAYPVVLDAGGGYTWFRGEAAAAWLREHPGWYRADGAVGQSNTGMTDYALEKQGTVLRIPEMTLAGLRLHDVGALGTGPLLCRVCDRIVGNLFWDTWQKNAPEPVVGWIGGNVLRDFRVTFDYPTRTSYWLRQREADPHDLDGVGLTLVRRADSYIVGGIVQQHGVATVSGIKTGDELIRVDGLAVHGAAADAVRAALGGEPGMQHQVTVERAGRDVQVGAVVTAF